MSSCRRSLLHASGIFVVFGWLSAWQTTVPFLSQEEQGRVRPTNVSDSSQLGNSSGYGTVSNGSQQEVVNTRLVFRPEDSAYPTLCHSVLFPSQEEASLSPAIDPFAIDELWQRSWRELIIQEALPDVDSRPTDTGVPSQRLRSNETLVKWVEQVFDTLTSTGLIQQAANGGASHPTFGLPDNTIHELMDIVQARIEYLQDKGSQKEAPPLHILVVGGSPTAGHGCQQNPFGMYSGPSGNSPYPECAWAKRLENVLNAILGATLRTNDAKSLPGIVSVRNMAVGGSQSTVSATLLEYALWPPDYRKQAPAGPDVILWGHAINDGLSYDFEGQVKMQNGFHQSASKLRPCSDTLPAVIYVDDWHGDLVQRVMPVENVLRLPRALEKVTSWYRAPVVSLPQAMRHNLWDFFNHTQMKHGLLGSDFARHPGMMHHITIGWTVAHHLLGSMVRQCRRFATKESARGASLSLSSPEPPFMLGTGNHSLQLKDLPNMLEQSTSSTVALHSAWQDRTRQRRAACDVVGSDDTAPCEYAWMSFRVTGITSGRALRQRLQPFLVNNTGWQPDGFPIRSPKLGWDAKQLGAVFELHIPIKSVPAVEYLTVAVMESYGAKWKDATVQIETGIVGKESESPSNQRNFTLTGYHEEKTSITITHRLSISPAQKGETVSLRFTLVNGTTFKIMGLALCTF